MINTFKDFYLNIKINNKKMERHNHFLNNQFKKKNYLLQIKIRNNKFYHKYNNKNKIIKKL